MRHDAIVPPLNREHAPWLGVELRHLAALEAVAAEGSFRRAATRLGYVQSAISQQIAALERAVGQRLLERVPGGGSVHPTVAGELVLEHARAILARLQAAQADLSVAGEVHRRELRVGITQSIAVRVLPQLIERFAASAPDVVFRPWEASFDLRLYEAVEHGDVELAFVELPAPAGPFELFELMADPYVLVASRNAPLASGPLSLRELASLPLIGQVGCRGLEAVEQQLASLGVEPVVVFRSRVNAVIQALVAGGVGAAVLPALAVDATDRRVVIHQLPELAPRTLALVRHRDRRHSDAESAFTDAARQICDELR